MAEKEYIEREAVKSKLKNMGATSPNKVYQNAMEDMIHYFIPKIIDEIPSADVVPVRYGAWANEETAVTCTACGRSYDKDFEIKRNVTLGFDYCPNCGAKMNRKECK